VRIHPDTSGHRIHVFATILDRGGEGSRARTEEFCAFGYRSNGRWQEVRTSPVRATACVADSDAPGEQVHGLDARLPQKNFSVLVLCSLPDFSPPSSVPSLEAAAMKSLPETFFFVLLWLRASRTDRSAPDRHGSP